MNMCLYIHKENVAGPQDRYRGKYPLKHVDYELSRAVGRKGDVVSDVQDGRMLVGLTQTIPDNIYRWAMTSAPKNGEIVFRSKTANAPLRVEFTNAYCVNFERSVVDKDGIQTKLLISPDEMLINGISFDNHWV